MNKKRISQLGLAAVILLCLTGFGGWTALQLLPDTHANPPVISEPDWNSPQTRQLMERACFDCHSNETKWPWYSNIPPFSQRIEREVREGRSELNYSEWRPYEEDESIEAILEGEMPPKDYLALHPEARLTEVETKALIVGLKATFGNSIEGEHELREKEEGENRHGVEEGEESEEGYENHDENDDDDSDDDDEYEDEDDD